MTPTLPRPTERGFTLVEMLVVLTIVAFVAAIGAATLSRKPGHIEREHVAGRVRLAIAAAERAAREQGNPATLDLSTIAGVESPLAFKPAFGSGTRLTLFPDGSSTGGTISHAGRPLLEIDWLTGEARDAR